MTPERKGWLGDWKEQAVGKLPRLAPVQVKVDLRQEVERALAAYGPEDAVAELTDIVTAIVGKVTDRLTTETLTQERETRKQQFLQTVDLWIDENTLTRLPSDLVGAPRSPQRRAVLATLRRQIRQTLAAELTGDEPIEFVVSRMQDELATWALKQNPQVDRRTLLRRLAPWVVTTVAGGIAAASWSPELKTVARTGARALKEKLLPYKPVATGLWNYGLQQLDAWAQARAKKETPDDTADQ